MQKSLIAKITLIFILCGLFGIGLAFVDNIIDERKSYYQTVMDDIKQTHVKDQLLATPFVAIANAQGVYIPQFASQSDIKTQAQVTDKDYKRSIYRAISYNNALNIQQNYNLANFGEIAPLIQKTETGYEIITGGTAESPIAIETTDTMPTPQANPSAVVLAKGQSLKDIEQAQKANPLPTPTVKPKEPPARYYQWNTAKLIIPVSDLRGVTLPKVTINGKEYTAYFPKHKDIEQFDYVEVDLADLFNDDLTRSLTLAKPLDVKINMSLVGIDSIHVLPLGEGFNYSLQANWTDPNFFGDALPTKQFSPTGFTATWKNEFLATNNNQKLSNCLYTNGSSGGCQIGDIQISDYKWLSTAFVSNNNIYTQTDRTLKYALLLVIVSFGTFFLFEVLKNLRIHPIQYGLVAMALLTFYVLVLSFAEHIAFWQAYSIASLACVGLIGWYTYFVLKSVKRSLVFASILGSLYAGFYLILASEGMNLLLGAVFCFALIAIVMFLTRHIDWYKIGNDQQNDDPNDHQNSQPALSQTLQNQQAEY